MSRLLKSRVFFFILGAIIFSGITGVVAADLASSKVAYDNTTSHSSKTTVQDAIDDLYYKAKHEDTLTLTNNQTSTVDMGENHDYRYVDISSLNEVIEDLNEDITTCEGFTPTKVATGHSGASNNWNTISTVKDGVYAISVGGYRDVASVSGAYASACNFQNATQLLYTSGTSGAYHTTAAYTQLWIFKANSTTVKFQLTGYSGYPYAIVRIK